MNAYLLVGLGGFVGTILRYFIGVSFVSNGRIFYQPILLVNLIGSALIGTFLASPLIRSHPNAFMFLVPGLLGGFTTFSSFSADSLKLIQLGNFQLFGFYLFASILGGIGICFLAYYTTRLLIS